MEVAIAVAVEGAAGGAIIFERGGRRQSVNGAEQVDSAAMSLE